MLGAFRSADAGPRGAAARIGLAALLACIGLTWTAGATSAFATYGTVKITKVNDGGDPADSFHFNASTAIKSTGGFDLKGGESYSSSTVHANAGAYRRRRVQRVGAGERQVRAQEPRLLGHRRLQQAEVRLGDHGRRQPRGRHQGRRRREGRLHLHQQRKTGTITVKKALVPATDTGKFDLQVDGRTSRPRSATTATARRPSRPARTPSARPARTWATTSSNVGCKNARVRGRQGQRRANVAVAGKDAITCTITNTARPARSSSRSSSCRPRTRVCSISRSTATTSRRRSATAAPFEGRQHRHHTVGETGANLATTQLTACKNAAGYTVAVSARRRGQRRRR